MSHDEEFILLFCPAHAVRHTYQKTTVADPGLYQLRPTADPPFSKLASGEHWSYETQQEPRSLLQI